MKRQPAVANQFYPGDKGRLTGMLEELVPRVDPVRKKIAVAVVAPHAGYVYSGGVAGETFSQVEIPRDVLIMGPNHHGRGSRVALMGEGIWSMPLGDVPINEEFSRKLQSGSGEVSFDSQAHDYEHSLEVQVPFLQHLRNDVRIIPLVIGYAPYSVCEEVGCAIARAVRDHGEPVLIVASTDMTHYESRTSAGRKDRMALECIQRLDPVGLYNTVLNNKISMCGIMPTTIALIAAKELGARESSLVRYTDSGERSGDTDHVVGYAGFVIT